jgi:heat shock protein HslJ
MGIRPAGFGAVMALLLSIGCTTDPPTTPTTDQLAGGWRLVALRPAGSPADVPAPANASYAVTFTDGRVSVRADCNTCNGVFSLTGQTLTAGPTLICTRAACPTMAFENTYTQLIAGDSTVSLNGNQLVLTSSRGTLRFMR